MEENNYLSEKIIIIEDDEVAAEALKELLNDEGYKSVFTCHSGEKGIQFIEECFEYKDFPGVILLDFQLPDLSGNIVLEKIGKLRTEEHHFFHTIMVSGRGTVDTAFLCSQLGAMKFIQKASDRFIDEILEFIPVALKEREMINQLIFSPLTPHEKLNILADPEMILSEVGSLYSMKMLLNEVRNQQDQESLDDISSW